jgi:hypothetical protein
MTLEDAGEDQIAHRQCRIERLCRAAAGVAQCLVAGPADPALPPCVVSAHPGVVRKSRNFAPPEIALEGRGR